MTTFQAFALIFAGVMVGCGFDIVAALSLIAAGLPTAIEKTPATMGELLDRLQTG